MGRGELRIDAEGEWYWEGNRLTRPEVISLFVHHLERHQDGSYWVHYKGQEYPVTVEGVPFFAEAIEETRADGITTGFKVRLKGGREVELPEGVIEIGDDGTPYVSLLGPHDTKLSRSAYWQLSRYLVAPEGEGLAPAADNAGWEPAPSGREKQPSKGAWSQAPFDGWRVECHGRVWPIVTISSGPSTPLHEQG